jgi:hypothetical protein
MTNKSSWFIKVLFGLLVSGLIGSCANLEESISSDWPDLRISRDEFRNISFIESAILNGGFLSSPLELYIGISESTKTLRLRVTYYGSEWIFFEEAILINDQGGNLQYTFDIFKLDRDVLSGSKVRETVDVAFSSFIYENSEPGELSEKAGENATAISQIGQHSSVQKIKDLLELLNGTNVRLRLTGDKYQDYKISNAHLVALRNMIVYYETITAKIE